MNAADDTRDDIRFVRDIAAQANTTLGRRPPWQAYMLAKALKKARGRFLRRGMLQEFRLDYLGWRGFK